MQLLKHLISLGITLGLFAGTLWTMQPLQHLQCLMPIAGVVAAQGIPSPPPGNPEHVEPPPGTNCVRDPKHPDHHCECHKRCVENTDGEGNPTGGVYVQEDYVKCRSACFKSHCMCPTENCE